MPSIENASHANFKVIQRFDPDYSPTTITQYESLRTGMTIVVVDQEGPKVNGYFTLATEIHDDSGAPHTLEHLCFMGSKSYQYKGVLDKLATRAYSNTNAWTATDHTAYTLDTAGWAGFAQILPVYLEHLIVPTLTDAGCYTEVHHIDQEGNDAGVVYSEMQGVQNNQVELMDLKSRRLMYPEENGFRYETGGMMEQLRVLIPDRIRDFHRQMYQPKNLCLILVGAVQHDDMLKIVDTFEGTILQDIPSPYHRFTRPWMDSKTTPPITKSIIESVEFPEEDESMGEISVSYFGPRYDDSLLCSAMNILLRYLNSTSASVLDNTIVEKEQLASGVYYAAEMRPSVVIQFSLQGVATAELESVEKRFHQILAETTTKPLDMKYLKECIHVERRQVKFQAESSAQFFTEPVIRDFLFGERDGSTLRKDLQDLEEYNILETWVDEKWRHWLKTWLVDGNYVTILGRPSAKLSEKLKAEEVARVEARKKDLGPDGLEFLGRRLAEAQAENDGEIPEGFLEQFAVPDPTSINFIKTTSARSGAARKMGDLDNIVQKIVDKDSSDSSLFVHFEDIKSNFAYINILIGTDGLPVQLRPLLALFMENFFTTPMERDGERIEFEQVIMELERDTVGYGIDSGRGLGSAEAIVMSIIVEVEMYERAIQWLRELMFQSIFDVDRLEATLARLVADIPDEKRSGSDMVSAVDEMISTSRESVLRARGTLVRAVYLKRTKKLLKSDPAAVIAQLKEINSAIFQPSNFRVLVIAEIQRLARPVTTWDILTKDLDISRPLQEIGSRYSRLTELGKNPKEKAMVVPMPTIDSSYLEADAKGPRDYLDPSIPAMTVAIAYLNAVEGPLWTAVRGTGLAYGTNIRQHVDIGQVFLSIYRSPDAFKAFNASKKVVEDLALGITPFDHLALEGTISSIVLNFANMESTMASAASVSFMRQVVRGQPKDWPTILLDKVRKVTTEEIQEVMKNVILPLFHPESSLVVVTCAPIMQDGLVKEFAGLGYQPEVRALSHFHDDYGLAIDENEEDAADDEDDEEEEEDDDDDEDSAEGEEDEDVNREAAQPVRDEL